MAAVEGSHWWYVGLRDLVRRTVLASLCADERPRILDAGCGTGSVLRMIGESCEPSYLGGFDLSPRALEWARRKAPDADVYESDIRNPEVRQDQLDLILSLDVIYVPGLEQAREGLRSLCAKLSRGGALVLHLPAYEWLLSEHDLAIHTAQRFVTRDVEGLFSDLGLEVELLSYRLCALFPFVALKRAPSMLRVRRGVASPRSDLEEVPGRLLNALLTRIVIAENRMVARGYRLPFGSSVFAVGRKA